MVTIYCNFAFDDRVDVIFSLFCDCDSVDPHWCDGLVCFDPLIHCVTDVVTLCTLYSVQYCSSVIPPSFGDLVWYGFAIPPSYGDLVCCAAVAL